MIEALRVEIQALRGQLEATQKALDDQRKDRKAVYERLRALELEVSHMPSPEEFRVLLNVADSYNLKREFWRKLVYTLVTKGSLAVAAILCMTFADSIMNLYKTLKGGG